jgi:hypothetical protein
MQQKKGILFMTKAIEKISPGGHPKSPTCGHLKIPHPPVDFSA